MTLFAALVAWLGPTRLRRIVKEVGLHGLLTALVVMGTLYRCRFQVIMLLNIVGMGSMVDLLTSSGDEEEPEDNFDDLPPLCRVQSPCNETTSLSSSGVDSNKPDGWLIFDTNLGLVTLASKRRPVEPSQSRPVQFVIQHYESGE